MKSDDDLMQIIRSGESDRVEFTESRSDLDKVRKVICAFANDLPDHREPGILFVGIRDDGSCADLAINDDLLKTLGGLRSDGKILPFPTMAIDKHVLSGCEVAVVQVEPTENPPIKVGGRCWIRVGPRQAQANADEERRLTEKRRWGNLPFDMQPVPMASEDNLDMLKFEQEYLPSAVSPEALEENDRDPKDQLTALRLITQDGVPTVTGILVVGKEPSLWFPGAYIQFVRYAGDEVTDPVVDHRKIWGPLPDQLRELDQILKTNIAVALDTQGEKHIGSPDYPYMALRELIRNAVIHRNYDETNAPVRVSWFSSKIEITNPGPTYGSVTKDNFGKGVTDYRNPTIADAMNNMGFMEQFGMGIYTARKTLEENGNPEPEFKIYDTYVHVTIHSRLRSKQT